MTDQELLAWYAKTFTWKAHLKHCLAMGRGDRARLHARLEEIDAQRAQVQGRVDRVIRAVTGT